MTWRRWLYFLMGFFHQTGIMSSSCGFDEDSSDILNQVMGCSDCPLEDVEEANRVEEEDLRESLQNLDLPPPEILDELLELNSDLCNFQTRIMSSSCGFDEDSNGMLNQVSGCFDYPLEDVEEANSIEEENQGESLQNLDRLQPEILDGQCHELNSNFCNFQKSSGGERHQPNSDSTNIIVRKSTKGKDSNLFLTSSPVSVLEGKKSSCSPENSTSSSVPKFVFQGKRPRNKRERPLTLNARPAFSSLFTLSQLETRFVDEKVGKKKPKKEKNLTHLSDFPTEQEATTRKCFHCEVTKTPQWREGPLGPKTLCNACGVRYRSGRLLPEYRPAASPTFTASLHSNSHRKVIEIRGKRGQEVEVAATQVGEGLFQQCP